MKTKSGEVVVQVQPIDKQQGDQDEGNLSKVRRSWKERGREGRILRLLSQSANRILILNQKYK